MSALLALASRWRGELFSVGLFGPSAEEGRLWEFLRLASVVERVRPRQPRVLVSLEKQNNFECKRIDETAEGTRGRGGREGGRARKDAEGCSRVGRGAPLRGTECVTSVLPL